MIAQGAWQSWSVQDARDLAVRAPSVALASIYPGVWVPSLRFSFGDHLSLVERRKYRTRCDCQFASYTSVLCASLFKFGFERKKCPNAWAETSFRRERPVKEEEKNNSKKVRRRTEIRRQQQRGGKFQRASIMFYTYTRITCRYGLD